MDDMEHFSREGRNVKGVKWCDFQVSNEHKYKDPNCISPNAFPPLIVLFLSDELKAMVGAVTDKDGVAQLSTCSPHTLQNGDPVKMGIKTS